MTFVWLSKSYTSPSIGRSNWLRCNDCHGGVSAGDVALGVAVGGLAMAAGALLVKELTKDR